MIIMDNHIISILICLLLLISVYFILFVHTLSLAPLRHRGTKSQKNPQELPITTSTIFSITITTSTIVIITTIIIILLIILFRRSSLASSRRSTSSRECRRRSTSAWPSPQAGAEGFDRLQLFHPCLRNFQSHPFQEGGAPETRNRLASTWDAQRSAARGESARCRRSSRTRRCSRGPRSCRRRRRWSR